MQVYEQVTWDQVERALAGRLPGSEAHTRMSTRPRSSPAEFSHVGPPRRAAVLILLYPHGGSIWLPLTRRTDRVANHKGQISLPGGAWETSDPSLWDTALREAEEEIGLRDEGIRRMGELSPLYIAPSHYEIQPFVAGIPARPQFRLDEREVAELIEFPLGALLDPATKAEETRFWRGRNIEVPFYRWANHVIWGATAMVLSEMEVVLTRELARDRTARV